MSAVYRLLALVCALAAAPIPSASAASPTIPEYDHIFLTIMENHGYLDISGNRYAPYINRYAREYGRATEYFSVADPSAPNYVAMIGGAFFGINSDAPYYVHRIDAPNLAAQLTAAKISWRGYFQGMPYAGYREICFPGRCNGIPDFDLQYASKHNGLIYFNSVNRSRSEMLKMVPLDQLWSDLKSDPPRFGYVVADECHDMHGAPPWCGDSGNPGDPNDNQLVTRGDNFVAELVKGITAAPFWSKGNNAIIVTWDEGDDTASCCGYPGTGRVLTVVITSHGPRHLTDETPYNHYSLLQTIERAFRLGFVGHAADTARIASMAPLFAVAQH